VTNPNDLILLNYHALTSIKQPKILYPLVATYEMNYQKGKVVVLGIYSDDIIANSKFNKHFDSLLLKYAPIKRNLKMGKPLIEILTYCNTVESIWKGRI
jgi:hypothetical protein